MPNSPTHFKEFNLNEYNQIFTNNIINKYTFELNNAENRMKITNNILSAEEPSSELDNSIKLNLKSGTTSKTVYELNSYSYTGIVNKRTSCKTALLAHSYLTRSGDNIIYGIMDPNDFTHKISESDSSTIVNEKSDVLFGFGNNVSDNDYVAGLSISGNTILGGLGSNTFGSIPIKAKYDYLNWSTKDGILYTKNTNNKIDDIHIWDLEDVTYISYNYNEDRNVTLKANISYFLDNELKNKNASDMFEVESYTVSYSLNNGLSENDWTNISSINGNNLTSANFDIKNGKIIDKKNKLGNFVDDTVFEYPSNRMNQANCYLRSRYKIKTKNNSTLTDFGDDNYNIGYWKTEIKHLPFHITDSGFSFCLNIALSQGGIFNANNSFDTSKIYSCQLNYNNNKIFSFKISFKLRVNSGMQTVKVLNPQTDVSLNLSDVNCSNCFNKDRVFFENNSTSDCINITLDNIFIDYKSLENENIILDGFSFTLYMAKDNVNITPTSVTLTPHPQTSNNAGIHCGFYDAGSNYNVNNEGDKLYQSMFDSGINSINVNISAEYDVTNTPGG